jgi:hypothetical protein
MEAKIIFKNIDIKSRKGFRVGQSVVYKGKEYKIHSFPQDADRVTLKKYKKNGTLDSRDKGWYALISDLK